MFQGCMFQGCMFQGWMPSQPGRSAPRGFDDLTARRKCINFRGLMNPESRKSLRRFGTRPLYLGGHHRAKSPVHKLHPRDLNAVKRHAQRVCGPASARAVPNFDKAACDGVGVRNLRHEWRGNTKEGQPFRRVPLDLARSALNLWNQSTNTLASALVCGSSLC